MTGRGPGLVETWLPPEEQYMEETCKDGTKVVTNTMLNGVMIWLYDQRY